MAYTDYLTHKPYSFIPIFGIVSSHSLSVTVHQRILEVAELVLPISPALMVTHCVGKNLVLEVVDHIAHPIYAGSKFLTLSISPMLGILMPILAQYSSAHE